MAEAESTDFRALIIAANRGDRDAYARLLHALVPVIRRLVGAARHRIDDGTTEDVVQDVLLSVHSVRASYDPARPFMPWLVAIARRRIADAARRARRRGVREVAFDPEAVTLAAAETNMYGEAQARSDSLRVAIAQLPRGQREAIEMLKLRELSLREASAVTGASVGALKVATYRAMTTLRALLKKT